MTTPMDLHGRHEGYAGGGNSPHDGLVEGVIVFVDTKNHTFRFCSTDGSIVLPKVLYGNMGPGGHGDVDIPRPGEFVTVCLASSGQPYLKGRPLRPMQSGDGQVDSPLQKQSALTDSVPGDFVKRVFGGAFLRLLAGGIAKIGVTPVCQIVFVKARNLFRLIAHTIELTTSGFHLYVSNTEGDVSTRLNMFSKDYKGRTFQDDFSKRADIDATVDSNGLSVVVCDVADDGESRKIKTTFRFALDGSISIAMGDDMSADGATGKLQDFFIGSCNFSHKIFDTQGSLLYGKRLVTTPLSVSVEEAVTGDYSLDVKGRLRMRGDLGASFDGDSVQIGNEESTTVETYGLLHNVKSELRA